MKTRPTAFKWTALEKVMKYLGILKPVFFIVMGILVLLGVFNVPEKYSLPFGSSLIAYGLFRAYRVFRSFFNE